MTNVFISYNRDDKGLAAALWPMLVSRRQQAMTRSLRGARWRETVVKKLDKADALVAVISKSTVESSWTMTELGIAWGANKEDYRRAGTRRAGDLTAKAKDVELLRVAKTDMAQLPTEILKATSDAPHRQER
jgi:hypothetical protein